MRALRADLQSEVDHAEALLSLKRPYDAGRILEVAFTSLLLKHLPVYVGVTRGVILSDDCTSISPEYDIILFDRRYGGGLVTGRSSHDGFSLLPLSVVFGVLSVKKTLTTRALKDALANLEWIQKQSPLPVENTFHYGFKAGDGLSFADSGQGRFFSGIVAFSNGLMRQDVEHGEARTKKWDQIAKRYLDGSPLDFALTLDGTAVLPMDVQHDKTTSSRPLSLRTAGIPKRVFRPYERDGVVTYDPGLVVSIVEERGSPETALALFLIYVQTYCADAVRLKPNLPLILRAFTATPPRVPMTERDLKRILAAGDVAKKQRKTK